MLTTEYAPRWLPMGLLAADPVGSRRIEIVQSGVFWGDADVSHLPDPNTDLPIFESWFLPWQWQDITEWRCYRVDGVGAVTPFPAGNVAVQPQDLAGWNAPAAKLGEHYKREIEERVVSVDEHGMRTFRTGEICRPLASLKTEEQVDDVSPAPEYSGWLRSYLAQKGQSLQPANLALKMSWVGQLLDLVNFDAAFEYAWLPVFPAGGAWAGAPVVAPALTAQRHVRAEYPAAATAGGTLLIALTGPIPVQPAPAMGGGVLPDPARIIRYEADDEGGTTFSPLRLRGSSLMASDTREWLTGLSGRAAGAFDLPQFLAGWLRGMLAPGSPPLEAAEHGAADVKTGLANFLNDCREYLIAASRDVLGFGRFAGPDKRHLAEDVWLQATADHKWFVGASSSFQEESAITDEQKNQSLQDLRDALRSWEHDPAHDTRQMWSDALVAACGKELSNPEIEWHPLADGSVVSGRAVEEFVGAAEGYVNFVRQPEIARKLIQAQWEQLPWANLDRKWVSQALAAIPDPARDQAEGLLDRYWEELFEGQTEPDERARQIQISNQLLNAILRPGDGAWDSRFDPATDLYPALAANPIPNAPPPELAFLARRNFNDYIAARFGIAEAFPAQVANPPPPNMETLAAVLFPNRTQVDAEPQPVRVAVDQPSFGNRGKDDQGDLNEELAGALLFVREKGSAAWRSLNLVEGWVVNNDVPDPAPLEAVFLNASPVGEQDGVRVAYRRFKNELPSIIVSPENNDDPEGTAPENNRLLLELPRVYQAPCVHYGREYGIAGGVMTDGGVLPAALRGDPATATSLAIPRVTGWTALEVAFAEAEYHCLRRVPVGPVRFAHMSGANLDDELFPIPQPAPGTLPVAEADRQHAANQRGIRPLACELPEWAAEGVGAQMGAEAKKRPKQNLLLIFPGAKPPEISSGIFGKFQFQILKPTTGFWNWFTWMDDWAAVDQATRIDEWVNELTQRQSGNDRQIGFGPLDDPAVENEIYCEYEPLFPAAGAPVSIFISYGAEVASRPRRSGSIKVTVTTAAAGGALTVISAAGLLTVTVPQGAVARLTFYSLVPKSQFLQAAHLPPPKFRDFMMDGAFIKGAKPVTSSAGTECIAFTPVELWVEAARDWDEPGLQETLEDALWRGLLLTPPDVYHFQPLGVIPDVGSLPDAGRRTVVLAEIAGALHFRIFDAERARAVDLPEAKLPLTDKERTDEVTKLRQEITDYAQHPTPVLEANIIARILKMTGWQRDRKLHGAIDRDAVDSVKLAQVGRLDVWHQIWRWDGREVPKDLLTHMLAEAPDQRDVIDSSSLKWDGAAFPTRPDYAHRSRPASLGLWRGAGENTQDIFAENLIDDLRAMYFRLSVRGFSRYEAVMGARAVLAQGVVQQLPKTVKQPWRRALVKAIPKKKLPKPSLRFAMPLTRDVFDESLESQTGASIMLVLDDVWFAENGLADEFSVGVRVLTDPNPHGLRWFNVGFDPTLTAQALNSTGTNADVHELETAVLGPYGITHDYAAKIPKLRGSCFVLRIPVRDLEAIPADASGRLPWFMCEIVTRRKLRPEAVETAYQGYPSTLAGEWSARTWVQFVPNTDLLLPPKWRTPCSGAGPKNLNIIEEGKDLVCSIPELPRFDDSFEERHERWLVLAGQITDMKGLPAENYLATFVDEGAVGMPRFVLRDGSVDPSPQDPVALRRGYLRFLLVRRRAGSGAVVGPVWESLFASEDEHRAEVMNDAARIQPIVTGRVPVIY